MSGLNGRIVVIDDDVTICALISAVLEERGFEVIAAADGAAGQAAFEAAPTLLVITDILMPGREGIETIRALRRSAPSLPILAMSASVAVERSIDYLDAARVLGASETIRKPLDLNELVRKVEALVKA